MHIFKIPHVISNKARGCSLGRYDDGLQKVAKKVCGPERDEEVLELLEKPVGTAPEALSRAKVVGSNPAGPTN